MGDFTFRDVTRETWPDFAGLFESRGGPKSCWCMLWRATAAEARRPDGPSRRAAIKTRIDDGVPVGILAYHGETPVAWCSIAPRETHRPLGGPAATSGERVWSVTCFFVRREFRGRGLARELLQAAVDHAARHGATVVEAYPVDPDSPSYRFMGFVSSFLKAGFHSVGRAGQRRHVVRLPVSPSAGSRRS